MSIAQSVLLMREDPAIISSLSYMMGPAITVARYSTMPERPAVETMAGQSDIVEVIHPRSGNKKPHPFPLDRIRAVMKAAETNEIADGLGNNTVAAGVSPLVGPPKGRPGDPPSQIDMNGTLVLEREQTNPGDGRRCRARKR
eukprot:922005-Alexandrium_andersonii.AAC.1